MLLSRGGEWYSERHGSCSMSASFREVRPCGLLRNNIMAMHGCGTLARLNLLYSTRPIFCSVPPSLVIRSRPPALWHAPRCPLTFGQLGTHGPFTPPLGKLSVSLLRARTSFIFAVDTKCVCKPDSYTATFRLSILRTLRAHLITLWAWTLLIRLRFFVLSELSLSTLLLSPCTTVTVALI